MISKIEEGVPPKRGMPSFSFVGAPRHEYALNCRGTAWPRPYIRFYFLAPTGRTTRPETVLITPAAEVYQAAMAVAIPK